MNSRKFERLLGVCILTALAGTAVGQVSTEAMKLLPTDGAPNEWFGQSVAIDGDTALVGACHIAGGHDPVSSEAYLFDVATGAQTHKLLPDGTDPYDYFGYSVAISGNLAVVGAWQDDDNGSAAGAAYLFNATTGAMLKKFAPTGAEGADFFGISVAISGSSLVVGAIGDDDRGSEAGAAYIFDVSDPNNPIQVAKLLANDGGNYDEFGYSVSIDGSLTVVGSRYDDDNGPQSGSAYVFDTVTGTQLTKLLPADGATQDYFGFAVAVSGPTVLVGARHDDASGVDSGSAYTFDGISGTQIRKLLPDDGEPGDNFGVRVALTDSTAVIGAYQDCDNGLWSGSAYVFDVAMGEQVTKLLASDGSESDSFGIAVAMDEENALIGAIRDDDNGADSGAAYLFNLPGGPNPCNNADLAEPLGILDLADINAFIAGFVAHDPIADINGDTLFDLTDINAFIADFVAGCP